MMLLRLPGFARTHDSLVGSVVATRSGAGQLNRWPSDDNETSHRPGMDVEYS
jgi:hypothetical protein